MKELNMLAYAFTPAGDSTLLWLPSALVGLLLSLLLAPLLSGIINRVKAIMGGRKGKPILQLYYDLFKLMHKRPVYPACSSFFFIAAGPVGVACGIMALLLVPLGPCFPLFAFNGDIFLLAGLFALSRFMLILAALDTGSAFEGMGAAREGFFSALAEPVFIMCLFVLAFHEDFFSLGWIMHGINMIGGGDKWPAYLMLSLALFLLLLLENSRIPVDDPNTHLELTMIHEVMILDHSGPDLALLEYASALKMWIFATLIAGVLAPPFFGDTAYVALDLLDKGWSVTATAVVLGAYSLLLTLALVFAVAVLVGLVESLMARYRMERVQQIVTMSGALIFLAALLVWR